MVLFQVLLRLSDGAKFAGVWVRTGTDEFDSWVQADGAGAPLGLGEGRCILRTGFSGLSELYDGDKVIVDLRGVPTLSCARRGQSGNGRYYGPSSSLNPGDITWEVVGTR